MKKEQTFKQQVEALIRLLDNEIENKRKFSANEVSLMLALRKRMAIACPETDGLQRRYRIKIDLHGNTWKEKKESLLDYVYGKCPLLTDGNLTYHHARLISLLYCFDGFSTETVYRLLMKEIERENLRFFMGD